MLVLFLFFFWYYVQPCQKSYVQKYVEVSTASEIYRNVAYNKLFLLWFLHANS